MIFSVKRTLDPAVEPVSLTVMKNYLRVDIEDDDDLISTLISTARERAEDMTSRSLIQQEWILSMESFPGRWRHRHGFYSTDWHRHHRFIRIVLPRGPVISVESITYLDMTGTQQTLDPGQYVVDTMSEPAVIVPAYGTWWPVNLWQPNSVQVKFTAGYQQTVTENATLSTASPCSVVVSRSSKILSLVSVKDAISGTALTASLKNGVITVTGGTVGQNVVIVYVVNSIPQSFIHAIKLICSTYYENRAEVVQGGGNFNTFPLPLSAAALLGTYNMLPLAYEVE